MFVILRKICRAYNRFYEEINDSFMVQNTDEFNYLLAGYSNLPGAQIQLVKVSNNLILKVGHHSFLK